MSARRRALSNSLFSRHCLCILMEYFTQNYHTLKLYNEAQTQSSIAKKEEEFKLESSNQSSVLPLKCLKCKTCDYLTFFQNSLDSHSCVIKNKFTCTGCANKFTCEESLSSHLLHDHNVRSDEIDFFISNTSGASKQADMTNMKKPVAIEASQPKSKIFIKDVTLLRKPDLLQVEAIPNIFEDSHSLDLTTEDDIFDDFLGSEDQIFDDDFDFDESANLNNVEPFPSSDPCPEVEIITTPANSVDQQSGKIFVRKNLCNDGILDQATSDATENSESITSKIYVRSHESLTSHVISTDVAEQPAFSTTPDCIIVSSEIIKEAPTSKIFIRNIETLTNPQQATSANQYYSADANTSENFVDFIDEFPPSIYVRSFDSLVNDGQEAATGIPLLPTQPLQQRCKISIKNFDQLLEPLLMQPPLISSPSMIGGQAQNLVIHMRPQQVDETLMSYRDANTPDTRPGSSNVSTHSGIDDVIILDDSELGETIPASETRPVDEPVENSKPDEIVQETSIEALQEHAWNDKPVLEKIEEPNEIHVADSEAENSRVPMVRIPLNFDEAEKEPDRRKVKIVKIIRIKKKKKPESDGAIRSSNKNSIDQLNNIQIVFKCSHEDCNQHFSSEQLLKYHKKSHSGTELVCPECASREFKTFNSLHTHLWRSHKIDMELFACSLCDYKTPILSRLKNFHESIHSNEKNYVCNFPECDKSFKNSKQMRNHMQIHKNKRKSQIKYSSSGCDKASKKIRCGECNKIFTSDSGLYIHSMEHKTTEKKFSCEECDYCTNDHNSFRRHKSQHSQVHRYKCPACDYTSIQSNTYRKHVLKQHPELAENLLFKCEICKFTTISRIKFDGHKLKHSGTPTILAKKNRLSKQIKDL